MSRLQYHFEPEHGWINDPNGLCWFNGQYHAFCQHYPHAPHWGPMHWGHAVSRDLVHWTELPIALFPDRDYEDGGGCFSGSAVVKDGVLHLFYTSVSKALGQTQSLALSPDGTHFEKVPENPLLRSPIDPESRDFRDPKVFPYGDGWRMVCGAGLDGEGQVLLFASEDLYHWTYLGPIYRRRDLGSVLECPDLFPLGDRWVLMFSRMDDSRAVEFQLGDFDGAVFTPEGDLQRPELGPDFYAAQSFSGPGGERLMMGWLYSWKRQVPQGAERAGALTLPRILTLEAGKVCSRPVPQAEGLLAGADPCLVRRGAWGAVTDGAGDLLTLPAGELEGARVLRDGPAREVFLADGRTLSFYWTEG